MFGKIGADADSDYIDFVEETGKDVTSDKSPKLSDDEILDNILRMMCEANGKEKVQANYLHADKVIQNATTKFPLLQIVHSPDKGTVYRVHEPWENKDLTIQCLQYMHSKNPNRDIPIFYCDRIETADMLMKEVPENLKGKLKFDYDTLREPAKTYVMEKYPDAVRNKPDNLDPQKPQQQRRASIS